MKRLNFNIQNSQYAWLEVESDRTGVSISELIRRAIDHFIESGPPGEVGAGWESRKAEEEAENLSFEEEVVHRLSMMEFMLLNLYPEKAQQGVYDHAEEYADEALGWRSGDEEPPEGEA